MKLRAAVAAVSGLFQPRYRPEAHYMRGPGPACAAKRRAAESAGEQPTRSSGSSQRVSGKDATSAR